MKNDGFNKRHNSLPSPVNHQTSHHERLRQEVANRMNGQPTAARPLKQMLEATGFRSGAASMNMDDSEQSQNHGNTNSMQGKDAAKLMSMSSDALLDLDDEAGGGRWTKEEDLRLRQGVQAIGATKWKKISEDYLDGKRSDVQCLHRWQKVLRPGLVKGPWTDEEDNIIRSCIERKVVKWSEIAERIPGRIGKQCRERWFNHLDPSIDHSAWTEEEEKVLVSAQAHFGNRWCEIAKLVPGRPENAVKNRWNSAIRKKWQSKLGLTITDNKGKPVNPQPPKVNNPLPLPLLEPVKKTHFPMQSEITYQIQAVEESYTKSRSKNQMKAKPVQLKKKQGKTQTAVKVKRGTKNLHETMDMQFIGGAASPGAPIQWDFNSDHAFDLSTTEMCQLSLDMNGIADIFNVPLSTKNSQQQLHHLLAQQTNKKGLASPNAWEGIHPNELDKGMGVLSIFDHEFDALVGPKTDDSFAEATYFKNMGWNSNASPRSPANP